MKKGIFFLSFLVLGTAVTLFSCNKDKTPMITPNLDCSDTISFNQQILPMITNNCVSCHGGGQFPTISNHAEIANHATAILNSLKGVPVLMPSGGPALPDSLIQQFECWINQGKLDN